MLAVADGIGNFYRRDTSKFKFSSNASNIANNFVINWENSLFSLEGIQVFLYLKVSLANLYLVTCYTRRK